MQEHVTNSGYAVPANSGSTSTHGTFITYYDIKRFIKRYYVTIAIATVIGIFLAAAYAFTSVPLYTARTQIIIDPSLPQTLHDQNGSGLFSLDNAMVESQLEVLRSEKIATAVINQLKLGDNPAFNGGPPSLLSRLFSLLRSKKSNAVDEFVKQRSILGRLQGGLEVRRVGLSYAIDIQYRSPSPELAAEIANATADAYVAEQIAARAQSARQGGLWLEERIDQLRKQMNKSALAAQEFRAKRDYRISPNSGAAGERGSSASNAASKKAAAHRQNTMEELDSTAQTYRRIYESYLMAYTESVQKQSYPITNARVITPATRPLSKSHPRTKLILAFGALMGGFLGLGIAFFRHSIDRSVWGAHQIREEVGVECVASIPLLTSHAPLSPIARAMLGKAAMGSMMRAVVDNPSSAVGPAVEKFKSGLALAGKKLGSSAPVGATALTKVPATTAANPDGILDAVITMPFSGFSHGIKSLKTAISLAGRMRQIRCIAITSTMPDEGKTTIAANLATLFAISGVRTLLVDGDIRNASLSRSLAPAAKLGLLEAICGTAEVGKCIVRVNDVGLDLLPASDAVQAAHSDEILGSDKAQCLLQELQTSYDIVIFELPPLTASLDALTMSSLLDCTVLVAEWGKTPAPILSEGIRMLRSARADILGVALNKVDISTLHYGDIVANYSYSYASNAPAALGRRA
jgi:polysaccharide biosynthesis transport protein